MKKNDNKPSILIISNVIGGNIRRQRLEILKKYFNLKFISVDIANIEKIYVDGVNIEYIKYSKFNSFRKLHKLFRNINFLIKVFVIIKKSSNDLYMFDNSPVIFIYPLLFRKKIFINNIYTGWVSLSKANRYLTNLLSLRLNSWIFNYVFIISEGLRDKLKISSDKTYITKWGAKKHSVTNKKWDSLHLLYIGTLNMRNIDETIIGFNKFHHKNNKLKLKYTILGNGSTKTKNKITECIKKLNLGNIVEYLGYADEELLTSYLNICNIGVSFVPITDYFNFQPVTKLYEYNLSGIPAIATKTQEQIKYINETNGVLVDDNADSFCEGLEKIILKKDQYSSEIIRQNAVKYEWENVMLTFVEAIYDILKKEKFKKQIQQ